MPALRPSIDRLRIKHLRLLEVIMEAGSLRRAAERLHLTQPAVSDMVKELEAAFGGELFTRSRGGMKANARAFMLLRRLKPVLGELRGAQDEMLTTSSATLRVGANLQFLTQLLPEAFAQVRAKDPSLHFVVREGPTKVLIDALLAGELDCTVGRLTAGIRHSDELSFWPMRGGELCLLVGRSHPLAARKRVTLRDLTDEAWALGTGPGQAREIVEQLFIAEGLPPPVPVLECRPQFANVTFAGKMQLVTVATRRDALVAQDAGTVHILPIDLPVEYAPVAFICRKVFADDPALKRLRQAVKLAADDPI